MTATIAPGSTIRNSPNPQSSGLPAPARPAVVAPRPSDAVYRRRRAIVGTVLAVFVAVGVVFTHDVLVGSGGVPASAAANQPAPVQTVITAQPGDSLWSIAESFRGEIPITRYVDKLVSLNDGPRIEAGQQVVLP